MSLRKFMALAQKLPVFSKEKYLDFERVQPERHEFLDGNVFAMAGESPKHSTICFNLYTITGSQLRGKNCRGFSPNMKVATNEHGLYSYPDLAVVCGKPVYHDEKGDVLLNPSVIFEVLSPSTENYDRGEKFLRYTNLIESLENYVLIYQDEPRIEVFSKNEIGRWESIEISGLDKTFNLDAIGCEISLNDLYAFIEFS